MDAHPLAPRSPRRRAAALAAGLALSAFGPARAGPAFPMPGATGLCDAGMTPVRGVTIGPIENARHPGRGYGSKPYERAVYEATQMGATWVSLTPFGRVHDLHPTGIDWSFEAPFAENRRAVLRGIQLAHAAGLRVLLVPHLWVESGAWRALIDPGDDRAWEAWARSYAAFAEAWARVAEEGGAELFSVGVEQRSWVTTARAPLYQGVIAAVRRAYHGPITYSGNWDDIEDTVILGDLDLIGVNAFYPLADHAGARLPELIEGGLRVRERVRRLAAAWNKPVVFTEVGYTTREDPAVKPWEWPDAMKHVVVDEDAQADAYAGLIAPLLDEPSFAGFFVWRLYADPDDTSQEDEWGFSPRAKLAELVVRDAFTARWAADGPDEPGGVIARIGAARPGLYPGPLRAPWW